MRNKVFTSTIAALALFAVIGLVAALAPFVPWPNLVRAHSPGSATLTALTVTAGGTAQTLEPTFSSAVSFYTIPVADSVTQITIEGTADGDGSVAYQNMDGTTLTDADLSTTGQQVAILTAGERINVVVSHTDGASTTTTQTYGVLVIREGLVAMDTIVLMDLYNSTDGANWRINTNWGSTEPLNMWHGVTTNADGRVTNLMLVRINLSGTIPASLGTLTNLTTLSLSYNQQLSGTIPASLANLTSLTKLELYLNTLSGPIPDWVGDLTSLTELALYDNKLTGQIPDSLGNLTSLTILQLGTNQLSGTIPASLGNLTSLTELSLNTNALSGTIPASLANLTSLTELRLHTNALTGTIPDWVGDLTSLTYLGLHVNELSGQIPASLDNLTSLTSLILYGNALSGTIPDLSNLTSLSFLYLYNNALTGTIPDWVGDLTSLEYLNLDRNQLSGTIPDSLGNVANLKHLVLYNNKLTGQIPDSLGDLSSLLGLYLSGNALSGTIPDSLGNLSNLTALSLWNNQLSGQIPASLGNLTNLTTLSISVNNLDGPIPDLSRLTSLQYLFLRDNQLTGAIPATLNSLTNLRGLSLQNNQLSGTIPDLSSLTNLQQLYLQNNALTGAIPAALNSLTRLTSLSLASNRLDGTIPDLSRLVNLTLLNLRNNQLSGDFPAALGGLTNLKVTRFASNPSLTGCVPAGLRYLIGAPPPDPNVPAIPAQDFIAVDANGDGDTDDPDDIPGLGLPFCMLSTLAFSDVTLAFASGTAAYTASVANTVESTMVTATLADPNDRLSIRKGTASYTSGDTVPLGVGSNVITIEITPSDARLLKQTYTVQVFREGSVATDRAALMALYNSAGGASWTLKTNWGETGVAIGTWHGVTTNADGRVTALDISGNNLNGTLPADLGTLTSLKTLSLSDNRLRGTIPNLGALVGLTSLDLSVNRLSGTIPDLSALTSLSGLSLFGNQLSGTIPDWLGSLTSLTTLDLGDNRLTGPIPEEWGGFIVLDFLYLNDNQLSGTIPAALGSLSGLRAARFAGNTLTGCVPNGLRYLVTASGLGPGFPAHDFIAVDKNGDGDTADPDDTPGLGLPFCTLASLALREAGLNDVTLEPAFASTTETYTATTLHTVLSTTVTATLHSNSDTMSIMKGANTYTSGDAVPLDVGPNVIAITVTTLDGTPSPHTYTVTVTRALNTPPAFDEGMTTTRGVSENTATGENIGDPVAATDPDSGDTRTYSLDAAGAESFDIVATTGQLQTKAALDYEDKSSYTVTVSVSDSKDDNGDADVVTDDTITVTILVSNVNEAPVFPSGQSRARGLDENTPPGLNIGAPVAATDDDNDTLTYSLDVTSRATFDIVATTGRLQTKAALDFEGVTTSYTVTVTAADPSNESATVDVTITVFNVEEAGTVTLSSTQPIVGTLLTATLTDPDNVSSGSATWKWERSPNGTSSWTPISGETSDSYTPVAGDVGDYLRATASYTDGEGAGKSAQGVSANMVRPAPTGTNTAPAFPSNTAARNVDENTRAGMNIGLPVTATDAENDALTYSLDATGALSFDIVATTGQLQTKAALDHEASDTRSVTVTATDTAGTTDTVTVTITVNNLDEAGTVTLSSQQPLVAIPLTASLNDLDNVSGSATWSWARSPNGASDWTPISGATSDSYTPVADDVTHYLRATASYTDGEAAGKSARAISANAVEVAPGRNAPVLREYPTATRSTPRNTPAGMNIGAPVAATDADNDVLTYNLGGPDAALFDIDASFGQLLTKALLTGIQRTSYEVFVGVSDGKDDLGNPETAPLPDTTTEVTINVTTTTISSGSSRSGSGGGRSRSRSRADPTPAPTPSPTPTPTGPQFSGVIAAEPSVTATVVPEGTTLGLNGGGDLPGGVYVNFPPTAVALPVQVSISVSNEAPSDVEAPSGTTLLPLTINITPETPLTLGTPLTIEINPTPEQLAAAGGDLNYLAVGVVTPNGIVVLPTQVLHGRLVVTIDHLAPFVLVAIADTGPVLRQPPMGDASSMGPLLQWTQPPETTWFQVQVIPFNEDGPGINLVIGDSAQVRAAQYQVLGPNFGSADPNYVLLPDMTYLWRVRTSTVLTNPTEDDWSAWAVSSFRTPPASSSTITRVAPRLFGEVSTLTPTLTWANSNPVVFYYEVQVSRDFEFGPNAFLYSEYVHGGASTPPNSYVVPEAFPLEAGAIYYWRVRPRIQGDGDPLPWSAINVFQTPG